LLEIIIPLHLPALPGTKDEGRRRESLVITWQAELRMDHFLLVFGQEELQVNKKNYFKHAVSSLVMRKVNRSVGVLGQK
jgi:hypothetical protein